MHIEIRPLSPTDAPACDAVIRSLPYHFGSLEGQRACAEAVRTCPGLVAVEDSAVVGFLTIEHHFEAVSEVTWMAVRNDRRGRGIGHALIERVCHDLRTEGRKLLLVTTVSSMHDESGIQDSYVRTRAFYRSAGFLSAKELPDLWPGNPAVLLARVL